MRIVPAAIAVLAALAAASAALAADAADGAVRTAPATADADTAAQIDAYLKASPAIALPDDQTPGVVSGEEPRKVHGEAGISVGTGGYRSAYAVSAFPVGKTGTLTVAVQDTQFGKGRGRGYGYGYGGWGPSHSQSMAAAFSFGQASDGSSCRPRRPGDAPGLDLDRGFGRDRPACPPRSRDWD